MEISRFRVFGEIKAKCFEYTIALYLLLSPFISLSSPYNYYKLIFKPSTNARLWAMLPQSMP